MKCPLLLHFVPLRLLLFAGFLRSSFSSFSGADHSSSTLPHPLPHRNLEASSQTGKWIQVGKAIDSKSSDRLDVVISSNGKRAIIGEKTYHNGNYNSAGRVRMFEESTNIGGNSTSWVQVGNDIEGQDGDRMGSSVALNDDGTRMIVGAVQRDGDTNRSLKGYARVLEEVNGMWVQVGEDIIGAAAGDYAGESVAMSSDGMRIAVGSPVHTNTLGDGHVRVFEEVNGSWVQVGNDIDGEICENCNRFGESTAMSSDGKRIIAGASLNNGAAGFNSGHARIYEEVDGTWVQLGSDIDGEFEYDFSGGSVDMSSDGKRVIIGADNNDGEEDALINVGHARIFEEVNGTWEQVGDDIDGEGASDLSGRSVAMSGNGKRVIIGATGNDGEPGSNSGHARIFEEVDGAWIKVGCNIDGFAKFEKFGSRVSVNSDGTRVIISAGSYGPMGDPDGDVRVYEFKEMPSSSCPLPSTPSPTPASRYYDPNFSSAIGTLKPTAVVTTTFILASVLISWY